MPLGVTLVWVNDDLCGVDSCPAPDRLTDQTRSKWWVLVSRLTADFLLYWSGCVSSAILLTNCHNLAVKRQRVVVHPSFQKRAGLVVESQPENYT